MNIKKIVVGVMAALSFAAVTAAPSQAQQVTFSSDSTVNTAFTYTSGVGLAVNPSTLFSATYEPGTLGATTVTSNLTFTGLQDSGNVQAVSGTGYTQAMVPNPGPGTFSLKSAVPFTFNGTSYGAGTTLLSGTFTEATLDGSITNPASQTATFRTVATDVVYGSGLFFNATGLQNPGTFSFGLTSVTPGLGLNAAGTKFNDFTAAASGNFTATNAPEPGTYAAFAFTGVGVMGLVLRARKSRGSMSA